MESIKQYLNKRNNEMNRKLVKSNGPLENHCALCRLNFNYFYVNISIMVADVSGFHTFK